MADDNTIIEGTVKFRDGKKWKSRWCVMRKLSPVADCVHLQLYREWRVRRGGGECKASLSLQHFLGCEAGFTLDKHSNTLALVCRDLVAVLAFDTRERLMQWQVKVRGALGEARHHLVLVRGGGQLVPAGPARLHLRERRFALTAGVPPRLLAVWELAHLRRYGVVDGRFCFEGGSSCGAGEGLHVLVADRAADIAADFDLASRGRLSPRRRPNAFVRSEGAGIPRSHEADEADARLPGPPPACRTPGVGPRGGEEDAASPSWAAGDMGHGDAASVTDGSEGADAAPWGAAGSVSLERCASCMSKLGALSRSSTAALTPGAKHFSPAWTMEALREGGAREPECGCGAPPAPPPRPPPRAPSREGNKPVRVGPYENYDVPKLTPSEVDGSHYDTPKRLKECLDDELFRMTRSATFDSVILKKPCGCLLKVGRSRRRPRVVESDESAPATCPCRRVTDWAHGWIGLPYCSRSTVSSGDLAPSEENANVMPSGGTDALYATVDLSRKTRRRARPDETNGRGSIRPIEIDDGPLADYENLNFALSLEHYENAKDLLRKAGVTRAELNAMSANLRPTRLVASDTIERRCARCGHPPPRAVGEADDYLVMEPESGEGARPDPARRLPAGYTPMSPMGGYGLDAPVRSSRDPIGASLEEKSASDPTLCGPDDAGAEPRPAHPSLHGTDRVERRKRSRSADSSRFLAESEGGRDSASSSETLREAAHGCEPSAAPGRRAADRKHSDADSSDASKRGAAPTQRAAAGNRDSSSSNDSGVSSCSLRRGADLAGFELPPTSAAARRRYRSARRAAAPHARPAAPAPRRARSSDPPRNLGAPRRPRGPDECSSAEAEVPVLAAKPFRGVADAHSTSSGTSDMSDYIETLSICSSHSSTDTPVTMRVVRQATSTLRPRSGKEYLSLPSSARAAPLPAPLPAPH